MTPDLDKMEAVAEFAEILRICHPNQVTFNGRTLTSEQLDALISRIRELEEGLRPFAKAGELFPEPPGTVEFDQCIYRPAAGDDYAISGDHLRKARALIGDE